MTPEERRLIADLFDRMRSYGAPDIDRDAEALINERVRAMREAPYMLTQTVLVQEQALEEASARIEELEDRLRELEEGGGQPRRSGGFLGGAFGGRWGNAGADARPSIGSRSTPSAYDSPQGWRQAPPARGAGAEPGGGGGFMRSAIATAAGVAGGVLAADTIRGMFGGKDAKAEGTGTETRPQETQQAREETSRDGHDDHGHVSDDDGGWFDGDGDGIDI